MFSFCFFFGKYLHNINKMLQVCTLQFITQVQYNSIQYNTRYAMYSLILPSPSITHHYSISNYLFLLASILIQINGGHFLFWIILIKYLQCLLYFIFKLLSSFLVKLYQYIIILPLERFYFSLSSLGYYLLI